MPGLLSKGSKGPEVSELQAALNFHIRKPAAPLNPDGVFGQLTDARVREFQRRAELKDDGLVGPNTIAALYRKIAGAIDATLTPRLSASAQAVFRPAQGGRVTQAAVFGGVPGFGQIGPASPDFVPPSRRLPQIGSAVSQGFDAESKIFFSPLADGQDGEHPLRLTLSQTLPWPIFLPEPLKLDIESTTPGVGKFQLDAKLKQPFKLLGPGRVELNPYFFVGGGVNQDHFKDVNAGGGANVKVKVLENIGGTGVSLGVEADGGGKYNWDLVTGENKLKGFFEGGVVFEGRF